MGIAGVPIEQIEESARVAANHQWGHLAKLRFDVGAIEVRPLSLELETTETCAVVAADAGLASVALAPFQLELLHVTDDQGRVYLTEFFPLTTLAADLRSIFERNQILRQFAVRLLIDWTELTDLWETASRSQPPMPRDVLLVADVLREIAEWAVAMELALQPAAAPTKGDIRRIVLHDGTLRSVLLRDEIITERMPKWWRKAAWDNERVAIAGVAKSSMLWQRLALALTLDTRVRGTECCYVVVPQEIEAAVTGRRPGKRFGFGRLVLLKWRRDVSGQFLPVDLPEWIVADRAAMEQVLSQILRVSQTTFPQPGYPGPLQQAHEAARLSEFESKLVRDMLIAALRDVVPDSELEPMLRYWSFQAERWRKSGRIGREG